MMRMTFVKVISLLLATLLLLNSGPRQIIETGMAKQPVRLQETALAAAPDLQFDALLRELQTAVSTPTPDLDRVRDLQDELAREHQNVLAFFADQEQALRQTDAGPGVAAGLETAVSAYQARYQTLKQHLRAVADTDGSAASVTQLSAFLDAHLPPGPTIDAFDPDQLPRRSLTTEPDRVTAVEPLHTTPAVASPPKRGAGKSLALLLDDPPTPADLAETIEIQFTAEITQLAASLNHNPVEIYNWVQNNIEFVPTWGSIQGAPLCLETRLCNAFDTSSLLIALLRASGIPARYQMGDISIPAAELMNWAGGFTDPAAAASFFASGGVPDVVRRVDNSGDVVAVRLKHVWVTTYVDYVPSRGAVHFSADTWIDLDASFKLYDYSSEIALFASGDDYFETYLNQVSATATIDPVTGAITGVDPALAAAYGQTTTQRVGTVINANFPMTATIGDYYETQQAAIVADMPILAADLPYEVLQEGMDFTAVPQNLQHQITFTLDGSPLYATSTAAVGRQRVSFSYLAASEADAQLLMDMVPLTDKGELDMDNLPTSLPTLANLRPDLRIAGQSVAQAGVVQMGTTQELRIEFDAPTIQTPPITNDIHAGEYLAVGINLAQISDAQILENQDFINQHKADIDAMVNANDFSAYQPDETVDAIFQTQIWSWFASLDNKSNLIAASTGVRYVRYPSAGMFFLDLEPSTLFGVPTAVAFAGPKMDVDRDVIIAMACDGDEEKAANFTFTTGLLGSSLEAEIPAQLLSTPDNQIEGISTAHGLALANEQQIPVYRIDETNIEAALPQLQLPAADLQLIQDSINAGMVVIVPERDVTFHGKGYLPMVISDPETGSSAFLIEGAGGAIWWFQTLVFALWFGLLSAIVVAGVLCPPCLLIVGGALLITPLPWLFLALTALVELTTPGAITGIFTDNPVGLIQAVLTIMGIIAGSLLTGPGLLAVATITAIQAIVTLIDALAKLPPNAANGGTNAVLTSPTPSATDADAISPRAAIQKPLAGLNKASQLDPVVLNYLYNTQNGDGSWGGTADSLNGLFPTTSIVVEALRDLEQTASASRLDAIQYLAAGNTNLTPFLARRVLAFAGSGQDVTADVNLLLARQNVDGGWSTQPGAESNVWDTALVLHALKAGGVTDTNVFRSGLTYFVWAVNPDGGWGLHRYGDPSHVFYTALVLHALNAHDATFALTGLQDRAITYLRNQQQADGGYGDPASTPFETALVLHAIRQAGLPLTIGEQDAAAYLNGQQQANGSWVDDPYSTALALRVLALPPDSDGDGMSDACETTYGLDPNDPSDALPDNDGDGLPNGRECALGTNPNLPDSDSDTVDDFTEVTCASDPLNGAEFNRLPQITSLPVVTVGAGQVYTYTVTAVDADADPLTFTLQDAPARMTINAAGLISWTPGLSETGRYPVVVTAADAACADTQPFSLNVLADGVDLAVQGVNIDNFTTDLTTLAAAGPVAVGVRNDGGSGLNGRFNLTLFSDRDGDAAYDDSADLLLGSRTFSGTIGSGAVVTLTFNAAGVVQFRDDLVYAWVDSGDAVPELDEGNNVGHSGQRSRYRPVRDWLPVVEWAWDAPDAGALGGTHPPAAAPLIDTNGDGLINERDVPAVVMAVNSVFGNGRLVALRGDTGEEIFSVPASTGGNFSVHGNTPAIGDLDGDGVPEIVVATFNNLALLAYNNDGSPKWQGASASTNSSNAVFGDLDGDGVSEILFGSQILNEDGTLHANAVHPATNYWGGYGASRHIADLDLDGDGEIVAGPSVYDHDGNVDWYWRVQQQVGNQYLTQFSLDGGQTISSTLLDAGIGDGWTSVANVDADPYPEIILTSTVYETMTIFEHDGQIHAGPWQLFTDIFNTVRYELGGTAVADFDGDGQVEIALSVNVLMFNNTFNDPSRIVLLLYETDGSLVWEQDMFPERVVNFSPTPSAFDFDGDGTYELLFLDRQRFYIVDGPTGNTLYETGINRINDGWPIRYPTVADVDNDGNAEVLVPTYYSYLAGTPPRNGLIVLGDANDNWPNARRVWNQWHYSADPINEDGTIPVTPAASWLSHNTYRAQLSVDGLDAFAAPDLSVSRVVYNDQMCPAGAGITARIGNGGQLHVAAGQDVSFYEGDPLAGGALITRSMTTVPLYPGEYEDVTVNWSAPTAVPVYVTVNEPITHSLAITPNLTQLPHTYVHTSGFLESCCVASVNLFAFHAIDGNHASGWLENGSRADADPRPPFIEVHFPFPVNASVLTMTNSYPNAGFLTGTISFSNGFTTPFTFDSNGEGVVAFPEQQGITWLRLTATATKADGASVNELEVGGSYRKPVHLLREGTGRMGNNTAVVGVLQDPCNPPPNQPPQITSAPVVVVDVSGVYSYSVTAVDPDSDPLTFTLPQAPSGMNINAAGVIRWTPALTQPTAVSVTVQVADGGGLTATQRFAVDVIVSGDVNHAPVILSTPPLTVSFGTTYTYKARAVDADGDLLHFGLPVAPAGMSMTSNGFLSWSPTEDQMGLHVVSLSVQDALSQTTQSFTVTVTSAGLPVDPPPPDADDDGWDETRDCDDTNPAVNPGQPEIPGNGIDDDCNPATPDDFPDGSAVCGLSVDRQQYVPGELIHLSLRVRNESETLALTGVSGAVSIEDDTGQVVFSETVALPALPPGMLYQATLPAAADVLPPAHYTAVLSLAQAGDGVCAETAVFAVTLPPAPEYTLYLPLVTR